MGVKQALPDFIAVFFYLILGTIGCSSLVGMVWGMRTGNKHLFWLSFVVGLPFAVAGFYHDHQRQKAATAAREASAQRLLETPRATAELLSDCHSTKLTQ
jgi:hypothetical protein